MLNTPVKVFVADDHDSLTDGLAAILGPLPGYQLVGRARDGEALLRMLRHKPVDVLLLDIAMPRLSGLEALPRLLEAHTRLRVIMLSGSNNYANIAQAVDQGAHGYLTKDADKHEILHAIDTVAAGQTYYNAEVLGTLERGRKEAVAEEVPTMVLTPRERHIVCLIMKELTSKEIGDRLGISSFTVERHRRNIFGKLEVKNVVGLAKYAYAHDLVREDCDLAFGDGH